MASRPCSSAARKLDDDDARIVFELVVAMSSVTDVGACCWSKNCKAWNEHSNLAKYRTTHRHPKIMPVLVKRGELDLTPGRSDHNALVEQARWLNVEILDCSYTRDENYCQQCAQDGRKTTNRSLPTTLKLDYFLDPLSSNIMSWYKDAPRRTACVDFHSVLCLQLDECTCKDTLRSWSE